MRPDLSAREIVEEWEQQQEVARDEKALELENELLERARTDSGFATAYALLRLGRMTGRLAWAIDHNTFRLGSILSDSSDEIAAQLRDGIKVRGLGEED